MTYKKSLQDELVALVHQYLNDMRHPVTDAGSSKRRIEAIEEVLRKVDKVHYPHTGVK
jgi:hypothetical protein